ncbi:hypothetical protein HMPREF0380_00880 [Eubacterium infirmum F0142]|nr:hypothetical protein HMPREF0380_00880 [Eubacterium infirmum F0142]
MFYLAHPICYISIHALARSATIKVSLCWYAYIKFQSTHSRGVRRCHIKPCRSSTDISIHALARSATISDLIPISVQVDFNPRTREECDTEELMELFKLFDFNPRTREECDHYKIIICKLSFSISIHALARSATSSGAAKSAQTFISIHALARSATSVCLCLSITRNNFNPRTREECDKTLMQVLKSRRNFNPRTREECDNTVTLKSCVIAKFQSTHSRGVRHCTNLARNGIDINFNPRTREECDTCPISHLAHHLYISIHALARSATLLVRERKLRKGFQSTHSRGVRHRLLFT